MVMLVAVKLKAPPAKAWWCRNKFENFPVVWVTVYEVKEERLTRRSPGVPIE